MQGHLHQNRIAMSDLPPDLPNLPSLISGLLFQLIEEAGLTRAEIADDLGLSKERVNALIATRTTISEAEYAAIASLLNRSFPGDEWTVQKLQADKDFWDQKTGKVNNGKDIS